MLRFLRARAFHGRRFMVKRMSMIGKRNGIYAESDGRICCSGRMILGDDVMLFSKGTLEIGDGFGVNNFSRIVTHEHVTIGDNVTLGQSVSILDHDHNYKMTDGIMSLDGYVTSPITIGSNVWIADKCTILKGVTIGSNVIIGANSLVNKDIPDNSIAAGSPARVMKSI